MRAIKSWFFSDNRSATYGTLDGTVLGFSPWMLSTEKLLNTPLLAVGGFAEFVDTDASMGLVLDMESAFACMQVVDCWDKDTGFAQAAVAQLDASGEQVPDSLVDMAEPVVHAVCLVKDWEMEFVPLHVETSLGEELRVCCP